MPSDEVLERALDTWGEEAQIVMAMQESSELITALTDVYRGRADAADVIDEIADVHVMLDQLALIFGPDAVDERIDKKLDRLDERLQEVDNVE